MRFKPILCALTSLCLLGCALPLQVKPTVISPSLLAPCPPHLQRELSTWGALAEDYSEALAELQDCAARHRALAEAVKP